MAASSLLAQLQSLETAVAYDRLPEQGAPFRVEVGSVPVLLSAPHAAIHVRDGIEKTEEEYTAAFARYLAKRLDCFAIFATHRSAEDPNWDAQSAYKTRLADLIAAHAIGLVVDVHGMTNRHNIGVAIGTMHGQSIGVDSAELLAPFLSNHFQHIPLSQLDHLTDPSWRRVVLNHPKFTGGLKSHTVTRFASQTLGVPALQIELASAARIVHRSPNRGWPYHYQGDPVGIQHAVAALTELITTLMPNR